MFLDVHMQPTQDMRATRGPGARRWRGGGGEERRRGDDPALDRHDHNRLRTRRHALRRRGAAHSGGGADPGRRSAGRLLANGEVVFHLRLGARDLPQEESASVVGEITGSEVPDEVVLLGAHLDSWDPGTGAVDDGAGVAVITEAARRIGELARHPKRTVRVVLFANEEFGLSGARAYAEAHKDEFGKIMGAAESDLGADPVFRLTAKVPAAGQPTLDALALLLQPLDIARNTKEGDGGADLSVLQGVPIVALEQDARAYFEVHHTANDTLDKIDRRNLDRVVAAFTTSPWLRRLRAECAESAAVPAVKP